MSDNWGDGWFLSVPRRTVRFILTMKVEKFGKGAGCRPLGISNLLIEGWCFQSLSWFSFLGFFAPWKTRRAEEGRSGMKMRRPDKNTKKITLAKPLGNKMLPLFFFSKKIAGGNENIKLRGETQSMVGLPSKKLGCEFRISKLPIATLKDGPFFWNDCFLNPSKSQKKSLTCFFLDFQRRSSAVIHVFFGVGWCERGSSKIPSKNGSDERS